MAEIKKIKSKLYQLIVGPLCIICGPLVFLLIESVNTGGSAASNLIFIFIGSGLIIVGLIYTYSGMIRLIKNEYLVVGDNYIELKNWNKLLERVNLTKIDIEDWGYIYLEQSSDNLFLVMLHAMKKQGLILKLGDNIVFVDRFRKGLLNVLRNKINEKVPSFVVFGGKDGKKLIMSILFLNSDYYIGNEKKENLLKLTSDLNEIVKPLVRLRTDDKHRLFLKVIEKINLSGQDSITKNKFDINEKSINEINDFPEYEITDNGFIIESIKIQPKKLV